MKFSKILTFFLISLLGNTAAELKLPAIISDGMVLQQKQENPIWGWDVPGTEVKVAFAGQEKSSTAGEDGKWTVKLDAVSANAEAQVIAISGTSKREIKDVLVGEVWMCSGQSNMAWAVNRDYKAQVESLASNHPNLRLISVPQVASQGLRTDFKGKWQAATPESVMGFSAVGFFYGRFLHEILDVPVGLIDNAWGGSAAEAWVRRESLESDPRFESLMEMWRQKEARVNDPEIAAKYAEAVEAWKLQSAKMKAEGEPAPRRPRDPAGEMRGNRRPGNIFGGVVHPTLGYGIKGVIWYQGESNVPRAWEYRQLFPLLIEQWRKEWGQGDFPFYWVQLADYLAEQPEPSDSSWAELREAQTMAMSLPNTGEAVIIDLGEAEDIHPRNKYDVAARLVRWALVNDYGQTKIEAQSPTFEAMAVEGDQVTLTFTHFGAGLETMDVREVRGFAVCGDDQKFVWAQAKIVGKDKVVLSAKGVDAPVAVRYAWADNPVCNVYSAEGLPLTPFRTDDFELVTKPKPPAAE